MPFCITENLVPILQDGLRHLALVHWIFIYYIKLSTDLTHYWTKTNHPSDYSTFNMEQAVCPLLEVIEINTWFVLHLTLSSSCSIRCFLSLLCNVYLYSVLSVIPVMQFILYCLSLLLALLFSSAFWPNVGKILVFTAFTMQYYCSFHCTSPLSITSQACYFLYNNQICSCFNKCSSDRWVQCSQSTVCVPLVSPVSLSNAPQSAW